MTAPHHVFFDTSALIKRYVLEAGSQHIAQYFAPRTGQTIVFVSVLTYVEVIAALSRRLPAPPQGILQVFLADYQRGMQKIPITDAVIERAADLAQVHRLRAADAVQLASALQVAAVVPTALLLTADAEMVAAAQANGLQVENPNSL
jgi:predicted nucleic acid-binding protein